MGSRYSCPDGYHLPDGDFIDACVKYIRLNNTSVISDIKHADTTLLTTVIYLIGIVALLLSLIAVFDERITSYVPRFKILIDEHIREHSRRSIV